MRLKIALLVIGGVLLFMCGQEYVLRSAAKLEPQQLSCASLCENGPGENAHINLTDFIVCDFAYVYEERSEGGTWSKVWVPAVPVFGAYHQQLLALVSDGGSLPDKLPMPRDLKVILKSSSVKNSGELEQLADRDTLQGLVINDIASLGSEEKKILEDSYPGVNFDSCWIVELDRTPASTLKLFGLGAGGLALAGAGVVLLLVGRN